MGKGWSLHSQETQAPRCSAMSSTSYIRQMSTPHRFSGSSTRPRKKLERTASVAAAVVIDLRSRNPSTLSLRPIFYLFFPRPSICSEIYRGESKASRWNCIAYTCSVLTTGVGFRFDHHSIQTAKSSIRKLPGGSRRADFVPQSQTFSFFFRSISIVLEAGPLSYAGIPRRLSFQGTASLPLGCSSVEVRVRTSAPFANKKCAYGTEADACDQEEGRIDGERLRKGEPNS